MQGRKGKGEWKGDQATCVCLDEVDNPTDDNGKRMTMLATRHGPHARDKEDGIIQRSRQHKMFGKQSPVGCCLLSACRAPLMIGPGLSVKERNPFAGSNQAGTSGGCRVCGCVVIDVCNNVSRR
jgi:hypothetical protein